MHLISRKLQLSIRRNLDALVNKSYTEVEIKELLVDLREISKHIKPKLEAGLPEKFKQAFTELIDVCDCIAHSNKDRGVIEKIIRTQMEKVDFSLENEPNKKAEDVFSVKETLNINGIVTAMLASIIVYLNDYENKFNKDSLTPVFEDSSDIGLCIISLLQDTFITLKKEHGYAILHILDYEGNFRLYYRVVGSTIEKKAQERTGGTGRILLGFPLIETYAENKDKIKLNPEAKTPDIIETYRDSNAELKARVISEI